MKITEETGKLTAAKLENKAIWQGQTLVHKSCAAKRLGKYAAVALYLKPKSNGPVAF